ncbi:MAG TPA: amino acid ABC transporter permease [Solirubrobacteraceae bacterium]|nr:amino acid ABC transporter permease [Solirubrobacteraceae bacterium]
MISTVSTIVVIGGLLTLLITSPGWPAVKQTFFSWSVFRSSFSQVLAGFWLDVRLFLVVEVVVLIAGLLIAMCRTTRAPALFPLRLIAIVYVDVLRGVPTILVVYLIGFGVPALMLSGVPTGAVVLGGFALALCYAAYVSEVFRAGIESIHPSQAGAALALGLTQTQAMRHVVLPQAVRRVVPPLLNDFISLQKDVALISVLGPQEAFRVAQIFAASQFNYTPLIAAALLYLCVTIPLTRIVDRMQARSVRERGAAVALGPR